MKSMDYQNLGSIFRGLTVVIIGYYPNGGATSLTGALGDDPAGEGDRGRQRQPGEARWVRRRYLSMAINRRP